MRVLVQLPADVDYAGAVAALRSLLTKECGISDVTIRRKPERRVLVTGAGVDVTVLPLAVLAIKSSELTNR